MTTAFPTAIGQLIYLQSLDLSETPLNNLPIEVEQWLENLQNNESTVLL